MIPEHLSIHPWYAAHQAWCQRHYGACAHAPPPNTKAVRADLPEAKLRRADLRDADLRGAILRGSDMREANLQRAILRKADVFGSDLEQADLRGADLMGAQMQGANLTYARLNGAVMHHCRLARADMFAACLKNARISNVAISGAVNITSVGPIGSKNRMLFAVRRKKDGPLVRHDGFWGTVQEARSMFGGSSGRHSQAYKAALDFIVAWNAG